MNGQIQPEERATCYYVDVTISNQPLLEILSEYPKKFIMFHAPRGSGKSTRVIALMEQLNKMDYVCLYATIQSIDVDHTNINQFWHEFGRELSITNWAERNAVNLNTTNDVTDWLSIDNKEFFGSDKVILIVDDFDKLYSAPTTLRDEILGVLRALKPQCGTTSCLWGFIAVGPCSILKLTQQSASPFNISDAFLAQSFTEEQVINLFGEFFKDKFLGNWDQRIAEDIYERTSGHAGLVCFCGKQIQQQIERGEIEFTTYDRWIEFAAKELPLTLQTQ